MLSKTARLLASSRFWLFAILLWAGTLFVLSSVSETMPDGGPEIPHIDKVLHFGYFMGGGFILTCWLLLRNQAPKSVAIRFFLPIVIFAIIGALDEYHQTFTPGRSGNDPYDWLADLLGAITGIAIANRLHPVLLRYSSSGAEKSEI